MVAESDWTWVGEDFRDGATDELEWVVLVASCGKTRAFLNISDDLQIYARLFKHEEVTSHFTCAVIC